MTDGFKGIHFPLFLIIMFSVIESSNSESILYPFGLDEGDQALSRDIDDISSQEIKLVVPVVFYGQKHSSLYVNQNGLVSFLAEIPTFVNIQFPLDYPSIAPLYSDVDTRIVGTVFYRETNSEELLERAKTFLVKHFSNAANFSPRSLFVVTWAEVGSYDRKSDKGNTFQLLVINDGEESYVVFIYDKIEWIQGTGKNPSMPDAMAQAGFISRSGPHFSLEGSGTDQVSNLRKRSNVDTDGFWAFRIGRVSELPGAPDTNTAPGRSDSSTTCASGGATTCHSRAECIDYKPGFCCKCRLGFYGNGKTCLENDIPERAVGKVKGVLNGIAIEDADLYSYVVPADGRAYTAVAKIADRMGYDLQSLSVIGTIFGWLFSLTTKGALNGFQLTGGFFNYTAEVSFLQTGHKVTINQAYTGLDVFNQMKVDTRLHGTTAVVPVGMKIEVNDFEVLMTRVSPGIIRSKSNHNYRIVGTSMDNPFSIEQTVAYEECPWSSPLPPELQTTKMMVGKSYIAYDASQEIVRYAISSTTSPPDGEDPCKENKDKCGPFSSCVADGESFRCICNLGYEEEYGEDDSKGPQCIDIDECRTQTSECDVTAHCINTEGSYECRCRETYAGDGFTCAKVLTCADVQCGGNAYCSEVRPGEPECRCDSGYYGDGLFCVPDNGEDDRRPDGTDVCRNCDRNAECIFSPPINSYTCACGQGYYGNGTSCRPSRDNSESDASDCRELEVCDIYADCVPDPNSQSYRCVCRFPFVGTGFSCRDSRLNQDNTQPNPTPDCTFGDQCSCPQGFYFYDIRHQCLPQTSENPRSCEVDPSVCDINAGCVAQPQGHRCVCNPGYDGDGSQCLPQDLCRSHAECGQYGECSYNRTELRYRCECREGFLKQGNECQPGPHTGCDVLDNCDVNGRCVWESRLSKFECECKPGYLGDGFRCQEDMTGCNVLNNCARNAECTYDTVAKAFRCHCRQGFEGDGTRCRSSIPCYQDQTVCDINAECVPNQETREWRCHCKAGFNGDGFDCHASGVRANQFLLVTKGMSIVKVSLNGEKSQPTTVDPVQTSVGIDIDCPEGMVYWSDVGGRTIKSSFFNGTSKTSFLTQNIGSPEGLSVDWASKNIYWTDSSKDTIEVANLQTRKRKTLISTDLVNPRGITVYPQRGRLFWSDWNRDYPKIEFSGMDGLGRQVLVGEGLALPNSLIIDVVTDQLCFADAGTHKIECVGIDGRGRRTFIANVKYPFGLALGSDTFYWSDWETKSIESASRRNGVLGQSIEVSLGGPGKLYGIVLVPKTCPQAYSPCGPGSCQDELICLPNIRRGRSCRCTDSASPNCKDVF